MTWRLGYTFNEGTGTTFAPAYGTGTGVCSAAGKFVAGTEGTALGTAGGGTASVTGSPILDMSTWDKLTVMADVTPDAGSGERAPLTLLSGANSDFMGFHRSAGGNLQSWLGDDPEDSGVAWASEERRPLTLKWDGTTVRVYSGTTLVDSYPFAGPLPDLVQIDLTRSHWTSAGGTVDNLRIADHDATVEEIGLLMGTPPSASDNDGPEPTPLDTPMVTITAENDPTAPSAADGEVTVSWSPVANAASYDAMIANSATPSQGDFTLHEAGVTSPYTFENQGSGTRAYGIIARAE